MAGLFSASLSMGLLSYPSLSSQNNAIQAETGVDRAVLLRNPEGEQAELVQMYRDMGLSEATATLVAEEIHADPELAVRVHLTQELGLNPDDQPSPRVAALSSFLCFALGAVFPLLPYLLGLN